MVGFQKLLLIFALVCLAASGVKKWLRAWAHRRDRDDLRAVLGASL